MAQTSLTYTKRVTSLATGAPFDTVFIDMTDEAGNTVRANYCRVLNEGALTAGGFFLIQPVGVGANHDASDVGNGASGTISAVGSAGIGAILLSPVTFDQVELCSEMGNGNFVVEYGIVSGANTMKGVV